MKRKKAVRKVLEMGVETMAIGALAGEDAALKHLRTRVAEEMHGVSHPSRLYHVHRWLEVSFHL